MDRIRLMTVLCFTLFVVSLFSAIGVIAYVDDLSVSYLIGAFIIPGIFFMGGVASLRKRSTTLGK